MSFRAVVRESRVVYFGSRAFHACRGFDNVIHLWPVDKDDFRPVVVYRDGVCSRCERDQLECGCLKG